MNENQTAVSVYSQDGMDDFPVLKAFQQYIDSEQSKARKRLVMLGVFFCILIGAVIAVFVAMLASVTARNQQLNDRLVEFAMKERSQQPSAIVQQPAQDNAIILAMTAKIDEMQKKLDESRAKAEKDAAVAAERERARLAAEKERARVAAEKEKERTRVAAQQAAAKPKTPSAEELEIKRLNTLLEIERQKAAAEKERRLKEEAAAKERRRQEELEAYRRKQYPELYKPKAEKPASAPKANTTKQTAKSAQSIDDEIAEIVAELDNDDDSGAITYFDDDNDKPAAKANSTPRKKVSKEEAEKPESYKIPVEVKKIGGRRWHVPVE